MGLDRSRNKDLKKQLEMEQIVDKIEQGQLRWFRIWMNNGFPVGNVWKSKIQHRKSRGRPARSSNEGIEEILQRRVFGTKKNTRKRRGGNK